LKIASANEIQYQRAYVRKPVAPGRMTFFSLTSLATVRGGRDAEFTSTWSTVVE